MEENGSTAAADSSESKQRRRRMEASIIKPDQVSLERIHVETLFSERQATERW